VASAPDVVERAHARRGEQEGRLGEYKRFLGALYGKSEEGTNAVVPNYSDGRPALRLATAVQASWSQRQPINLLPGIVDSFVALRGMMPTVRVLPEGAEEDKTTAADKRTRGLREQYRHSKFKHSFKRAANHLVSMGETCITLDPWLPADAKLYPDDKRPLGIYIAVVSPANAFPSFRIAMPGDELDDLFLIWNYSPEQIKSAYGITCAERADVITYYSRTEKMVIVAEEGKAHTITSIKHNLGFCPAQWVSNKATDGRWAQSDIRTAIDLHEQLQLVYNIYLDSLLWATWPIIHSHNATAVSQGEIGPGAIVETVGDGTIELLAPAGNSMAALQMIQQLTDALSQATGVSPIQTQGVIDKSNVSGRSVDRQQGPMESRLVFQNDILGDAVESLNEKILTMLYEIPELKKATMPLYGQDKDTRDADQSFTGESLGGWTSNEVVFDPLLGSSRHERLNMALQLHKESQGMFPISQAIREFGIDDPDLMLQEGMAEAKMLMEAQQAAQPQQPQAAPQGQAQPSPDQGAGTPPTPGTPGAATPGAGSPGTPSVPDTSQLTSLQGAGQPSTGLPPFDPSQQQPGQSGMGSPAPVPDISTDIQQVLDSAQPRLKGTATLSFDNQGPEVLASDQSDIPLLRQVLTEVWSKDIGPGTRPRVRLQPKGQ